MNGGLPLIQVVGLCFAAAALVRDWDEPHGARFWVLLCAALLGLIFSVLHFALAWPMIKQGRRAGMDNAAIIRALGAHPLRAWVTIASFFFCTLAFTVGVWALVRG